MIKPEDVEEAIAECEGRKNPGAQTCIQLAALYTIREHLNPRNYSRAGEPPEAPQRASDNTVRYNGHSEFAEAVEGQNTSKIIQIMDELMEATAAYNPPLYRQAMRRIRGEE